MDWPPLGVEGLKFRALALRRNDWSSSGLCLGVFAGGGAMLLVGMEKRLPTGSVAPFSVYKPTSPSIALTKG